MIYLSKPNCTGLSPVNKESRFGVDMDAFRLSVRNSLPRWLRSDQIISEPSSQTGAQCYPCQEMEAIFGILSANLHRELRCLTQGRPCSLLRSFASSVLSYLPVWQIIQNPQHNLHRQGGEAVFDDKASVFLTLCDLVSRPRSEVKSRVQVRVRVQSTSTPYRFQAATDSPVLSVGCVCIQI